MPSAWVTARDGRRMRVSGDTPEQLQAGLDELDEELAQAPETESAFTKKNAGGFSPLQERSISVLERERSSGAARGGETDVNPYQARPAPSQGLFSKAFGGDAPRSPGKGDAAAGAPALYVGKQVGEAPQDVGLIMGTRPVAGAWSATRRAGPRSQSWR